MKYETALKNAKHGSLYFWNNPEFKNDKELVVLQLSNAGIRLGRHLESISENLRNDPDVIMAAVNNAGGVFFKYAGPDVMNNYDLVMCAVKTPSPVIIKGTQHVYRYLPDELKADREVAFESLKLNPLNLRYCPKEFKDDKELVILAVKRDGEALKCASKRLRDDKEVLINALKNSGGSIEYASDRLRGDYDTASTALSTQFSIGVFKCLSDELKNDKELFLKAIKRDCTAYKYASNRLQLDPECRVAAKKYAPGHTILTR